MDRKWTGCAVLVALGLTGCGGGHSQAGTHSVIEVGSALHAVGLDGFRAISTAEIRQGEQTRSAFGAQFLGGFSFVRHGTGGVHPPVVAISIAIAKGRSAIGKLEKEAGGARPQPRPVHLRLARAGNVLIVSVSEHADAVDRRILSRIPKLVAYLDAH